MKTTSLKAFLILGGSMLIGGTMQAGITDQFIHSVSNELSNFHVQALFVIGGIIAAGLTFYFLTHFIYKEEKPQRQKVSYSQQRRQHHRAVVKKTA